MKSIDKNRCIASKIKLGLGLLLMTLMISASNAQTVSQERDSHRKIKSFIDGKYPEAKSIWIINECWGYRTTFKMKKGRYVSSFSFNNDWLQTESKVRMADIPESVKQGYKSSKYDEAKVLMAKKVILPQEPSVLYVLEIRTTQHNDDLNDNYGLADTKDHKLYFTIAGQLAKEEEEPGETIKSIPWGGQ